MENILMPLGLFAMLIVAFIVGYGIRDAATREKEDEDEEEID